MKSPMSSSQSSMQGESRQIRLPPGGLGDLPSPSPVMQRIRAIVASPGSSARDIVAALKLDPVTSGKVLRLANSASIGIPRTVSSLQNAVVLLGQKRVLSLVTVSELFCVFKKKAGGWFSFSLKNHWRHSITTAMVAESIARHLSNKESIESEEVFSAGILHDIGKLALGWYDPERMAESVRHSLSSQVPFHTVEHHESSHPVLGAMLLDQWNFPHDLTEAVRNHHSPLVSTEPDVLTSIVHLSDVAAHILGFQTFDGEAIPAFNQSAVERIDISAERLKVIAQEVIADEQRIESAFTAMD